MLLNLLDWLGRALSIEPYRTKDGAVLERSALRTQAEARLHAPASDTAPAEDTPEASTPMQHELRLHQLELEIQNEQIQRLQAQLLATTKHYSDLYDQAPVAFCSLSDEGLILQANLPASTLLGLEHSALLNQPLARFIFPAEADSFYLMCKELRESGRAQTREWRMLKPDGTRLWVQVAINCAQTVDGTPQLRLLLSDISERKTQQLEHEQYEQRLELALMGADLGLWDINIPSGTLHLSARACTLLGYPEGGLGKLVSEYEKLVHPEDAPERRAIIHALENGDSTQYRTEHRMRHREGHWVWIRAHGKVVERDENARPLRVVGTMKDISLERHLKHESTELLQRLESLIHNMGKMPELAPLAPRIALAGV